MVFKYYKTFQAIGVASGAEYSDTWDVDEDLILKRIHIMRQDGVAINKSTFYLKIKDRVYTLPVVPAAVLSPSALSSPVLEIAAAKGEKLAFTFKNLEGTAIDIYISFECWTP